MNITRFSRLEEAFESLVHGGPVWLPGSEGQAPVPFRVEVTENDKEYQVLAEMPGVKKDEINIAIDGIEVVVFADVRRAGGANDGRAVLRAERYYGKIQREFIFREEIDDAAAQAKFNDGILELTLPKKTVAAAKRVTVD